MFRKRSADQNNDLPPHKITKNSQEGSDLKKPDQETESLTNDDPQWILDELYHNASQAIENEDLDELKKALEIARSNGINITNRKVQSESPTILELAISQNFVEAIAVIQNAAPRKSTSPSFSEQLSDQDRLSPEI